MHRPAFESTDDFEIFSDTFRVCVTLFPLRAAIIQTVSATGGTKIVGDQAAGFKPLNGKFNYFGKLIYLKAWGVFSG